MGGMGGGLCFLNKKPWHPGSIKNMEKVSKREIEAEISKKKREEKIKELKKDKELEEMLRLSYKSEAKSIRNMSLDWMYKGEIMGKSRSSNSLEENINASDVLLSDVNENVKKTKSNCIKKNKD